MPNKLFFHLISRNTQRHYWQVEKTRLKIAIDMHRYGLNNLRIFVLKKSPYQDFTNTNPFFSRNFHVKYRSYRKVKRYYITIHVLCIYISTLPRVVYTLCLPKVYKNHLCSSNTRPRRAVAHLNETAYNYNLYSGLYFVSKLELQS